jgi:hypothetical protein
VECVAKLIHNPLKLDRYFMTAGLRRRGDDLKRDFHIRWRDVDTLEGLLGRGDARLRTGQTYKARVRTLPHTYAVRPEEILQKSWTEILQFHNSLLDSGFLCVRAHS